MCSNVDFPEPEGPVTARTPPGSSEKETESRAVIVRAPAWHVFVTRRHVTQATRPDKTVYRLTAAGERELERWLEAPFVRQSGYRDDFFLKLLAASRLGSERLARVLAVQREAYLGDLASLGELK